MQTTSLGLKKPELTDNADLIAYVSDNMDLIDSLFNQGGSSVTSRRNTVTLSSDTNTVAIGVSFSQSSDTLMAFKNSVYIENGVDYGISGGNIVKSSGTWESGTEFNFVVLSSVASDVNPITNDQIAENSIPSTKLEEYNQYNSSKDANGIFTVVEYKRADLSLYMKSTLSNPDANGNYQTATLQYYATDGTTLIKTETWTMTYDADGDVTSTVKS